MNQIRKTLSIKLKLKSSFTGFADSSAIPKAINVTNKAI